MSDHLMIEPNLRFDVNIKPLPILGGHPGLAECDVGEISESQSNSISDCSSSEDSNQQNRERPLLITCTD